MEYSDFYDLAEYGNTNWKGSFTPKEIACNAYDYLLEFKESCKQHKATRTIQELLKLLKDDNSEESLLWAERIENTIHRKN